MEASSPSINVEENTNDEDVVILDDAKTGKRKTSEVWNNFKADDEKKIVKCNHCGQTYAYDGTKNGTSTFSRHLLKCTKKLKFGNINAMFLDHDGKLKSRSKPIDQKICREWMTMISVAHDLPLNWVEYEKMRGFLKYLNSDIKFITRNTHASDVMVMYECEKEKLKLTLMNLPGMLCLTSDVWTACTNSGYICLTVHYVDAKWKLNSKILAFCSMPPPHSGPELAQKIYDCLVDWKIDKKVFSLTLDNASSNNAMVRILQTRLNLQSSLLCNGEYFHVRCCAHILNLIVQEGLKVASDALDKIRGSIKYVKGSEARMMKFKECAKKIDFEITSSVCLDVPTRWNSTYLMLASALKYRRVFGMLAFDDLAYKHCPTEKEWERGQLMCEFLAPFYTITTLISGSSYPTSDLYFMEVWKIARLLEKNLRSQDEVVRSMSIMMKAKFAKYWEEYSDILSMGAVFDPRIKLKFLEYFYSKIDPSSSKDKVENLKMKLYILYDEYKKRGVGESFKVPQASSSSSSQVKEHELLGGGKREGKGRGLALDPTDVADYKNYKGGSSDTKSQLDIYLEEAQEDEELKLMFLSIGKLMHIALEILLG